MVMSTSQPPRRYGRDVTLIAVYSSGDGARFWCSQCSRSSERNSTRRPNAHDTWQLAPFDHRVDRTTCRAQQRRGFVDGEQHGQADIGGKHGFCPAYSYGQRQLARPLISTNGSMLSGLVG